METRKIYRLSPNEGRYFYIGNVVRHFKKQYDDGSDPLSHLYIIRGFAHNANNDNPNENDHGLSLIVYQALYGDHELYVRYIDEFSSRVDKDKYPDSTQTYRFEVI